MALYSGASAEITDSVFRSFQARFCRLVSFSRFFLKQRLLLGDWYSIHLAVTTDKYLDEVGDRSMIANRCHTHSLLEDRIYA